MRTMKIRPFNPCSPYSNRIDVRPFPLGTTGLELTFRFVEDDDVEQSEFAGLLADAILDEREVRAFIDLLLDQLGEAKAQAEDAR